MSGPDVFDDAAVAGTREDFPLDYGQRATLLDLVDRVLDKGVVLTGEIVLSVADVDLVYVSLRAFIGSMDAAERTSDQAIPVGEMQ